MARLDQGCAATSSLATRLMSTRRRDTDIDTAGTGTEAAEKAESARRRALASGSGSEHGKTARDSMMEPQSAIMRTALRTLVDAEKRELWRKEVRLGAGKTRQEGENEGSETGEGRVSACTLRCSPTRLGIIIHALSGVGLNGMPRWLFVGDRCRSRCESAVAADCECNAGGGPSGIMIGPDEGARIACAAAEDTASTAAGNSSGARAQVRAASSPARRGPPWQLRAFQKFACGEQL
eukprot:3724647-Rhodomonas_salina.2